LFVFDDSLGDSGVISSGWSLHLTTVTTVNPITDLGVTMSSSPATLFVGGVITNRIGVTNLGLISATGVVVTNTSPVGVNVQASSSSPGTLADSSTIAFNVGSLPAGSGTVLTVVLAPTFSGVITNVSTVRAIEADLNTANNTARTTATVSSPVPPVLSGFITLSNAQFHLTVTGEPGLAYIVQGSTNLSSWISLATNTATNGTIKYIDTAFPNFKYRFYRAVRQLP